MTSSDVPSRTTVSRAKSEGALIALAAGDALGWPQEFAGRERAKLRLQASPAFRDWERSSGGRYYAYSETIRAGEYSDDTQLTLATARCRIHAGAAWWAHFTRNELPLWTIYERGGGGATKRAAESWLRGRAPWKQADGTAVRRYFDAGGNGVTMRVVPHAIYFASDEDPTNLLRDVVMDGAATHGHPRALVGAAAYAYAAWWLLRAHETVGFGELITVLLDNASRWGALPGASAAKNGWLDAADKVVGNYEKLWTDVVEETRSLLACVRSGLSAGALSDDEEVLAKLGAFGKAKGAGTVSAAAAIYLAARYAAQPTQGVLRAAFAVGADTDTIAAMTGGLLGALAGTDWIPEEWFEVQDCQYLRHIANKVAARATSEVAESHYVTVKEIDALIGRLVVGSKEDVDFDFGGTRRVRVIESWAPPAASNTTVVQAWRFQVSDGQTLFMRKLGRKSRDDGAPSGNRGALESPASAHQAHLKIEARAAGVKLSVRDLATSSAFYEGVLGLTAMKKTINFVSFGALSLVDGRYAVELSGGAVALDAAGMRNRVEVHVPDLGTINERLDKDGVRIVQPVASMPWGERCLHCLDPDGNLVEVVERRVR
ncbi:MAG: hypothetical protein AMXMBFR33_17700 [Candidatus Xenobia bacterium]